MKTTIDNLTDAAGWTVTNGTATATTWEHLAASWLGAQLLFKFTGAGIASKDLASPVDVSASKWFALSLMADSPEQIATAADFRAKIRLIDTAIPKTLEYYCPLPAVFGQVQFYNDGLEQIDRIEIEALQEVSFFASELIGFADELPIDIYRGINALLEKTRATVEQLQVGTITGAAGSDAPVFNPTGGQYIDRYAVVEFGGEIHMISEYTSLGNIVFSGNYFDGSTLQAAHADAPVYLYIPITTEPGEDEIFLPSISLNGGFQAALAESAETESVIADSWDTDDNIRVRRKSSSWDFDDIIIEAESRNGKPLEKMMLIMSRALGRDSQIYINGRIHDLTCESIISVDYGDATDINYKVQAICSVRGGEEYYEAEKQSVDFTRNLSVGVFFP